MFAGDVFTWEVHQWPSRWTAWVDFFRRSRAFSTKNWSTACTWAVWRHHFTFLKSYRATNLPKVHNTAQGFFLCGQNSFWAEFFAPLWFYCNLKKLKSVLKPNHYRFSLWEFDRIAEYKNSYFFLWFMKMFF